MPNDSRAVTTNNQPQGKTITIRLSDGRALTRPAGTTPRQILEELEPKKLRQVLAAKVNGQIVDLSRPLTEPVVELQFLTFDDPEGLWVARHSCAHVMAEAICSLWPQTKLVYGPPVENGFYYDIDLDHPITPEDFEKIEARMAEIVREDRPFTRYELPRDEAMKKLEAEGNEYKIDNALRAEGDVLSFYVTGELGSGHFEDLCRGPHVPSTSKVGAFKIMQVAGAYHHGDASKKMLQRVYGTTWPNRKLLRQYLDQLEQARKRDHRRIGQELGLFALDPLVGPGLVLWKPRGAVVRHQLESFMREQLIARGYEIVYTPHIGRLQLYRTSGHFPYYKEAQFPPLFESERARLLNELWEAAYRAADGPASDEERAIYEKLAAEYEDIRTAGYPFDAPSAERRARIEQWLMVEDGYLLKPMNCPHHIRIYASEPRSYRDLPVRLAEFGTVYRHEKSGEVHGLTRVRGFTQDDAHIFCTNEQLQAEIADCVDLTRTVLDVLELRDFEVRVGLRDESDKYVGSAANWQQAEQAIRDAVTASGLPFTEERGEAAFYGPKIDFVVRDCIGRKWQLGTVQVDYNLPERFGLEYIGPDNQPHRPVMVHRAPFGSLERFTGILIEHFAGAFPTWLAPVQVLVASVSQRSAEYAGQVYQKCRAAGLRVELDAGGERIGAKIRQATLLKVPYILVVGEQEMQAHEVNVRTREGKRLGSCSAEAFIAACRAHIDRREARLMEKI